MCKYSLLKVSTGLKSQMDIIRQSLLLAPETDDVVFPYKSRRESVLNMKTARSNAWATNKANKVVADFSLTLVSNHLAHAVLPDCQ